MCCFIRFQNCIYVKNVIKTVQKLMVQLGSLESLRETFKENNYLFNNNILFIYFFIKKKHYNFDLLLNIK